jgi:hypothetical protein
MLWLIFAVFAAALVLSGGQPRALWRSLKRLRLPSQRMLIVMTLALLSLLSLRTGRVPVAAGLALAALALGLYAQRFGTEPGSRPQPGGGKMTVAEAYRVLGLPDRASAEEIKAAHRRLMLRAHPDLGGSDYLAAKLNEAKDVLLGRG